MNSQTARRPDQRPPRNNKNSRYRKQTARFDARRDGKPLIFGWGKHLSHNEKVIIQRRATWTVSILIALLIIAVIIGSWVNINVIIPGQPIASVDGQQIPQSQYRKMVAFKTQLALNNLYGPKGLLAQRKDAGKQVSDQQTKVDAANKQVTDLESQISKLPAGPGQQRTDLETQLTAAKKQQTDAQALLATYNQQLTDLTNTTFPAAIQNFTQSQVGNESIDLLTNNELIVHWLANQSQDIQNKINPSTSAVNSALKDFQANIPSSGDHASSYSKFLQKDSVSNDDILVLLTIKLRNDNMQNYLSSLIVSPAYQVLARSITIATESDAKKVLADLQKGADFGKTASSKSVDATTSTKGGYMGWLARGQYALQQQQAVVENWLFDPARKLNEISPVLSENGSFHIVQILGFDPARDLDANSLKTLKDNALVDWVFTQKALAGTKVTPTNQNMLLDPLNMPADLPVSAPAVGTTPTPAVLPTATPTAGSNSTPVATPTTGSNVTPTATP